MSRANWAPLHRSLDQIELEQLAESLAAAAATARAAAAGHATMKELGKMAANAKNVDGPFAATFMSRLEQAHARAPAIRPTALVNLSRHAHVPAPLSPSLSPGGQAAAMAAAVAAAANARRKPAQALSPSGLNDSLPSLIMPHLYVGSQEQTNRETVNKLNIKYILSLGLLPMITSSLGASCSASPSKEPATEPQQPRPQSPQQQPQQQQQQQQQQQHQQRQQILMPSRNCSRDFKIRIRTNNSPSPTPATPASGQQPTVPVSDSQRPQAQTTHTQTHTQTQQQEQQQQSQSQSQSQPHPQPSRPAMHDENQGVKQVRSVRCKCINISDNSDQSLSKFFDEAYAFIEEARGKKCNILVHCLAGISRSPTIAIAYLMRARSLHWRDAYELVKQCRPQIDPNLNFMGQLRIYNRCLREHQQMVGCKRAAGQHSSSAGAAAAAAASTDATGPTGEARQLSTAIVRSGGLASPGLGPAVTPVRD